MDRAASERFTNRSHRLVYIIGYLLILVVALRRRYDLAAGFNTGFVFALLGLFTVFYAIEGLLTPRKNVYRWVYFALQMAIIQTLGLFQEYQDTWAVLYVALALQVPARCPRREALAWFGLFAASIIVTLCVEFGLVSGPGRALAYIMIGVLMVSFDIQYGQHEDTLSESQLLLSEQQEAHRKLEEYTAQAEKLAAIQERDRMVQELYDSVGQKIFAIQLAAESTRILLGKDPQRAGHQIDDLQMQTQTVLGQMRQLIDQWRPG